MSKEENYERGQTVETKHWGRRPVLLRFASTNRGSPEERDSKGGADD